ncbi:hypothetical protein BPO_1652 [Bergeyella porcorum]|uniref:GLPGLI family protein n=1 Tax=Bergeyella porcorum TaxID=1735111 RepID=A0AAU0F2Z4_9FLAO
MRKITLLVLFIYTFFNAQSVEIEYSINKDKSNTNYSLFVEGQKSLFVPKDKCEKDHEDKNLIPLISSEIIVEKDTDIKIFDKIGRTRVYYKPNIQKLSWEISTEVKQENGFNLQKATTTLRDKKWIVWYITDITIIEGPYLFKGLPGLVYSVNDENNTYQFQLTQIKKEFTKCSLDLEKYKEITEEKYISTINTSNTADNKLLESLMKLDIPKDGLESLNNKISESNILRGL